jgi:DNA-binding GntR family transcriptional regulator
MTMTEPQPQNERQQRARDDARGRADGGRQQRRPAREGIIQPVVQESTPSMIATKVREAIAHGELPPGTQLGEADLARALGVSRGPLREGMQRLTQEGLLISIRNRGLFVVEMTPETMRDVYIAREAVERAAAAEVHRIDPAAASVELLAITDTMSAAKTAGEATGVEEADFMFHRRLVELAASPRLTRMHSTLLTETRMCLRALAGSYVERETRVEEHRAIAEAIADGDAELTDRLLVEHMQDGLDRLDLDPGEPDTER